MIPDIELDEKQAEVVGAISHWYNNGEQVGYLAGQAGTGKTTVARYLARQIGVNTAYAAFTGKAADVLRRKGMQGASTLHSLIYRPKGEKSRKRIKQIKADLKQANKRLRSELESELRQERSQMRPGFELVPALGGEDEYGNLFPPPELIVLDEVSMVDEGLAKDLLSFDIKVLTLGDPYQLPPIAGQGFLTNREPDFMLTELHRTAARSPVYVYSETIRTRGADALRKRKDGASAVWPKSDIKDLYGGAAHNFDQVICWTNRTRHTFNTAMREELGLPPDIAEGDRIICLENNSTLGCFNGEQFYIEAILDETADKYIVELTDAETGKLHRHTTASGAWTARTPIWKVTFDGHQAEREFITDNEYDERQAAGAFSYAYCITAHKSQGSEWDRVLVVDETPAMRWLVKKGAHEKSFPSQWLYTAVTRAAKSVVVVR